ncbi:hypothetical protein [Adhaeribacter terreus]|uniref:Uncharacterized protein n=1 Tax=Adhaeribacter terreus TaxID=529703 RepID=A0ABW0EC80_9BACT
MYIIRDTFYLKFGHYKAAKTLLDEAVSKNLMPVALEVRVFSDFTGDAYRLIIEKGHKTLADYEKQLSGNMSTGEWQKWYEDFKQHVERSHREILKQVV